MIRFNAKDGLVSVIADDILAIQDAVKQNIMDRLGIIVKKHGIKGDTGHSFTLSYAHVSVDTFEVTCSSVGPVVFDDYVYVPGDIYEETAISTQATLAGGETKVIYIGRSISYSNDQEAYFQDGHPVDDDGNPPVSGYNIESEHVLTLGLASSDSLPTDPVVILGTITRTGLSTQATITCRRRDAALSLNDFGLVVANDIEIENLEVTSLHQASIIKSRSGASATAVDRTPDPTDMTANKLYLNISWDPADDTFAYQVQLQIIDQEGRAAISPTSIIVPHLDDIETISTQAEVLPGLRYKVSVRSLASNPNHDPGSRTSTILYAGASGLSEGDIIQPPALSISSLHGDSETGVDTTRHTVEISVAPDESTPEPSFTQIFRLSAPLSGQKAIPGDAVLIYEGAARSFIYDIPDQSTCYFAARTVGPGFLCSSMVSSDEPYVASTVSDVVPRELAVRIPISLLWTKATPDPNPMRITGFHGPAPYCRVRAADFYPHGSAIITTAGGGDDTIGVELVIGREGMFVFNAGSSMGFTAYTGRKMVWEGDELFQSNSLGVGQYLTPEDYYKGFNSFSIPTDVRGDSWDEDDEIKIWLCVYDADTNTSHVSLQGDLILIFERTMEAQSADEPLPGGVGRT